MALRAGTIRLRTDHPRLPVIEWKVDFARVAGDGGVAQVAGPEETVGDSPQRSYRRLSEETRPAHKVITEVWIILPNAVRDRAAHPCSLSRQNQEGRILAVGRLRESGAASGPRRTASDEWPIV